MGVPSASWNVMSVTSPSGLYWNMRARVTTSPTSCSVPLFACAQGVYNCSHTSGLYWNMRARVITSPTSCSVPLRARKAGLFPDARTEDTRRTVVRTSQVVENSAKGAPVHFSGLVKTLQHIGGCILRAALKHNDPGAATDDVPKQPRRC